MAKRKWYRFPLYLLTRAAAGVLWALPRKVMLVLAACLGELGFWLVVRQRAKALQNLRRVYAGIKSDAEIRDIARGVFRNMTMTAVELLQFSKLDAVQIRKLVDVGDGFKVYDRLLSEGKGLISITAHIGNWDLLAGVFGLHGYKGAALGRRIYYEPYNDWIVGLRQAVGIQTIYRDTASREILKRLKRNETIGILPDQDLDSLKGIFVDYFGLPAYTTVAPVRLSLASGAPILVNFLIRQGWFRYKLVLGPVLRPFDDADREAAVEKYTRLWMQAFEKVIREYPEQWGWMHDRWKTQTESASSSKPKEVETAKL